VQHKNKFILLIILTIVSLSLISCAGKSVVTNLPINSTNTPSPNNTPTVIVSLTPAVSTPEIIPSPTEIFFSVPEGRILFEAYNKKEGLNYSVIKVHDMKNDEAVQIIEYGQEVDGQIVNLIHPSLTWSPDGHWVAFVGTDIRSDVWIYGYQDIFVAKADGTELHRLTYSPEYDKHYLSWSPDGNSLLVAMGINQQSDLYLVGAKNGEILQRFTSSGKVFMGTWSPDGKKIAYGDDSKLFIMNADGTTSTLVSKTPINLYVGGISWSSNGYQISFTSSEDNSGCDNVYVNNIITGETTRLTSLNQAHNSPVWSPDGKYLAFTRATYDCKAGVGEGFWDVYISNLMGDEQKIISNASFWTSISWAPVPSLEIGKQYAITELGANLNLRVEPSMNGKILEKLPIGDVVTVLEGFVDANDYYWWKIRTQDGTEGWAVEMANWYAPLTE